MFLRHNEKKNLYFHAKRTKSISNSSQFSLSLHFVLYIKIKRNEFISKILLIMLLSTLTIAAQKADRDHRPDIQQSESTRIGRILWQKHRLDPFRPS